MPDNARRATTVGVSHSRRERQLRITMEAVTSSRDRASELNRKDKDIDDNQTLLNSAS